MIVTDVDLWAEHANGAWLVVPTNTQCKADGSAVMGAGLALAVARRWPDVPKRYGRALARGQRTAVLADHRLLLAPTKERWRDPSSFTLVRDLLRAVGRWCDAHPRSTVLLPAPGCGRGGLPWEQVMTLAFAELGAREVIAIPPLAHAGN